MLEWEIKAREDDHVTLDELRASLDLERSRSEQLSDVVAQLRSDLASKKAHSNSMER